MGFDVAEFKGTVFALELISVVESPEIKPSRLLSTAIFPPRNRARLFSVS
jgi:hypothetical protein